MKTSGSPAVEASIFVGGTVLGVSIAAIDGSATSEATEATGTVSYASPNTAGEAWSGGSCSFWFPTANQGIVPGRIWVTFRCTEVLNDPDACGIDESAVLFENCAQ